MNEYRERFCSNRKWSISTSISAQQKPSRVNRVNSFSHLKMLLPGLIKLWTSTSVWLYSRYGNANCDVNARYNQEIFCQTFLLIIWLFVMMYSNCLRFEMYVGVYLRFGGWTVHSCVSGVSRLGNIHDMDLGPPPPIMKSFKEFLVSLDDSVDETDAVKHYNEYKIDYRRQQMQDFFLTHKDEEWYGIHFLILSILCS